MGRKCESYRCRVLIMASMLLQKATLTLWEYTLPGTLRVYLVIVDLKRDQMSNTMSCARYRATFSTLASLTALAVVVFRR